MTALDRVLFAFLALVLAICNGPAAHAQPVDTPQAQPDEMLKARQLEAPVVVFQNDALDKLERRARELAGNDEAKFTMLLREGLMRLPRQVENKERALAASVEELVDDLEKVTREPSDAERDPALQEAVKRALQEAREAGTRMVGATPVPSGFRLDTVAIFDSAEPNGCSGVVIAPGAVLTAAHCVCDFNLATSSRRIVFGNNVTAPLAVAFTKPLETRIFPSTTTASVYCADFKKFAEHGFGKVCHRDVALLRFDPKATPPNLTFAKFASKAEMDAAFVRAKPPVQQPIPKMNVVGFGVAGIVSDNGILVFRNAGEKRFAFFDFYFDCPDNIHLDCAQQGSGFCFGKAEMVIQDIKANAIRSDSCGGDSGGPAFLRVSDEWRLAGLVSRALGGGCGPGGVYSSIYHADVLKWLHNNGVPGF